MNTEQDKLPWMLFGLLVCMCVLLGILLAIQETSIGHGFNHPKFATMQQGGSGMERHSRILWGGWLLGLLQILFFIGLIALAVRRNGRLGKRKWPLLFGTLLYGFTFTMMVLAYQDYAATDSRPLFLSFPIPSAWMLFGVWMVPIYFIVLYFILFERWIINETDIEKFRRIVTARRERESQ